MLASYPGASKECILEEFYSVMSDKNTDWTQNALLKLKFLGGVGDNKDS